MYVLLWATYIKKILLLFLEPVNRHLEGDDVRILGNRDVAKVGYFIINC